jgi:hypothetical protein
MVGDTICHVVFEARQERDGSIWLREANAENTVAKVVDVLLELGHADVLCVLNIFDSGRWVIRDGEGPPLIEVGDVPSVRSSVEQGAGSCSETPLRFDHFAKVVKKECRGKLGQ